MKYLSIDIETTGLDSENHQILSIGVIIEDTEKKLPFDKIPKFHCAIVREEIRGGLFAINLNKDLLQSINTWSVGGDVTRKLIEEETGMVFLKEDEVVKHLFKFLYDNDLLDKSLAMYGENLNIVSMEDGSLYPHFETCKVVSHLNVAGKNFGTFDKLFLEKLPRWKQVFKVRQRIIDPTILFTDWKNDEQLPNLTTCKERAKTGGEVTHDAIDDAWDVIQLLRTQY